MASAEPGKPALGDDPRCRHHHRYGSRRCVPDPSVFRSGRQFAAWLGLVPRQNSSGGKERLGRVSKMGNGYLRRLLVVGATSVTRRIETTDPRAGTWIRSLLKRKPTRLVTVPIANKIARTVSALHAKGGTTGSHQPFKRTRNEAAAETPRRDARADMSDDDRTGPPPGHPEALSERQSSMV